MVFEIEVFPCVASKIEVRCKRTPFQFLFSYFRAATTEAAPRPPVVIGDYSYRALSEPHSWLKPYKYLMISQLQAKAWS